MVQKKLIWGRWAWSSHSVPQLWEWVCHAKYFVDVFQFSWTLLDNNNPNVMVSYFSNQLWITFEFYKIWSNLGWPDDVESVWIFLDQPSGVVSSKCRCSITPHCVWHVCWRNFGTYFTSGTFFLSLSMVILKNLNQLSTKRWLCKSRLMLSKSILYLSVMKTLYVVSNNGSGLLSNICCRQSCLLVWKLLCPLVMVLVRISLWHACFMKIILLVHTVCSLSKDITDIANVSH
jgi:hypothetical protein